MSAIRTRRPFSYRRRMMAILVCICILVSIVCMIVYSQASYASFVNYARETQRLAVSNQVDQLNSQLNQIESLILILMTNKDINALLNAEPSTLASFNENMKNAHQTLNDILMGYLPIAERVGFLYIEGENGLTIRKGPYSYSISRADYVSDQWYRNVARSTGQTVFGSVITNYVLHNVETLCREYDWEYVLPIYKRINQNTAGKKLGEMILMLTSDTVFPLKNSGLSDEGISQVLCSRDGTVMFSNHPADIGSSLAGSVLYRCIGAREQGTELTHTASGDSLVVFKKTSLDGAYIIRTILLDKLYASWPTPSTTMLAVLLSLFCALIASALVSAYFSRPVSALTEKVNRIAASPLTPSTQNMPKPNCRELLFLDDSIDNMHGNIVKLWAQTLKKEEEKQQLEMRMLRMQINPHFLYNTLNSIRWMAAMQGAHGIDDMISSLAELLYAAFQQDDAEIPISRELEVLENYIRIQKMQLPSTIHFHVKCADPELMDCAILIFTLQPLVENAVFHGLKPKRSMEGNIVVHIEKSEDAVLVSVEDDGVGIGPEMLDKLLKDRPEDGKLHIGVANVHRRIQLFYGDAYGVSIVSQPQRYTRVTVRLPQKTVLESKEQIV